MAVPNGTKLTGPFSFRRGVHPPHRKKFTEPVPIERVTVPAGGTVVVPMIQHIGAPCSPTVEKKQEVTAGQEIGASDAFVSAPVHSPVNGVVKDISAQPHPNGRNVLSAIIQVAEDQPAPQQWVEFPPAFQADAYEPDSIVAAITQAGVVGQGGAAFPAAVKLKANPKKPVDTMLVNGCECEPYLTSDHRLMLEAPRPIVAGMLLAMRAAGAQNGIIALEDNKPDAINSILPQIQDLPNIQLAVCKTKYPQGGERQLITAVLNRVVPTGGLPLDVGVVVGNVGTMASIAWACLEGRPVTERIVTVTGAGVHQPGNFRVPVGMLVADLIEQAGGLTDDAKKVLLGGPMMGPATPRLDVPVLKGTSGITVMTSDDVSIVEATACIRCSRCVDFCPIRLVPTRIAHSIKARDVETAEQYDLAACIECGCCSYVCPAQIPLVQYMRSGKLMARARSQK